MNNNIHEKKMVAWILALVVWWFWVHKFYLWDTVLWVVYVLFCWTWIPSIIWLIEWILYLTKTDEEFAEKYLNNNDKPSSWSSNDDTVHID